MEDREHIWQLNATDTAKLRDVRRELASVHPATLASLAVDVEDFAEQARTQLGETADASIEAERRDRAERQGRLF